MIDDLPYHYNRFNEDDETVHVIVDSRDGHVVGRYEHMGIAVTVGAALNDEHTRLST